METFNPEHVRDPRRSINLWKHQMLTLGEYILTLWISIFYLWVTPIQQISRFFHIHKNNLVFIKMSIYSESEPSRAEPKESKWSLSIWSWVYAQRGLDSWFWWDYEYQTEYMLTKVEHILIGLARLTFMNDPFKYTNITSSKLFIQKNPLNWVAKILRENSELLCIT